jgi:predicted CoA-binding protein
MKTLVLGASTNPSRYSNMATLSLLRHKHQVELIGKDKGNIEGIEIENNIEKAKDIDTVTLYINPKVQENYQEAILNLKPRRVIFNPGTENPILQNKLTENGIEAVEACTLVMLSTNQY